MKEFEELGKRIEDLWRAENYDEERLPDIAAKTLAEERLPEKVTAWDVLEWTAECRSLPVQHDLHAKFGDPPVTLFNAPRFHIDVYFWFEGTTAMHRHAFCGAFQVLHGSSIHSWYEFEREKKINFFAETGEIRLRTCELLNVGDVQEIRSGARYIHSLFHLEQPSATIVVRTVRSPLDLPQFSYYKPCLAVDPFFEEPSTIKKIQAVAALFRAGRPEADETLLRYLEESDFHTSFLILSSLKGVLKHRQVDRVFGLTASSERFERFVEAVAANHPDLAGVLPQVFEYRERQDKIVRQRSFVDDPELRFFLALLLNVEGRERIFGLIKERFPEAEPLEKVLDWVHDLAATRVIGADVPNALGVEGFDDADLVLLENMLKGMPDADSVADFAEMFGDGDPESAAEQSAKERIVRLREAVVFAPLLK